MIRFGITNSSTYHICLWKKTETGAVRYPVRGLGEHMFLCFSNSGMSTKILDLDLIEFSPKLIYVLFSEMEVQGLFRASPQLNRPGGLEAT